jgi:hypothetical protein
MVLAGLVGLLVGLAIGFFALGWLGCFLFAF